MTLTHRASIAAIALLAAFGITFGAAAIGYQVARGDSDAGVITGLRPEPGAPTPAAPLPTDEASQASFAWNLYKTGHLVPALIVAAFFLLLFLEKKIAWLRTGYRKVFVASALGSLGMLAERVASGTTPNLSMLAGAIGVGLAMWMKTEGAPKK